HSIRAAAIAKINGKIYRKDINQVIPKIQPSFLSFNKIIAIGASTGGPQAIQEIITSLPPNSPACVIVLHMPAGFTKQFADRLNGISAMEVCEAQDNTLIEDGKAYIAPGDKHLSIVKNNGNYFTKIKDGPLINYQKPSIDVLFYSVASQAKENAVGVLLTGMGSDGAEGLLAMHKRGAYTIAQDEESSAIFGMPQEAIKLGAVNEIAHLKDIASSILKAASKNSKVQKVC
ncbi:MAG: chemotaxis protein CheB, partial [Candidatus Schekmanbacteria bacterium]